MPCVWDNSARSRRWQAWRGGSGFGRRGGGADTARGAIVHDFEKLGEFYLGRRYDLDARARGEAPVLYDSRDLVTHGMIIGMTGSGKTGLGIGLLEEAAIDGVPAIAIDPKGDLGNLLLTFPSLAPDDFRPWINEDEARRKGLDPEAFAADQATLWQRGLAEWGQDASRIAKLRDTADLVVYTPGSSAGRSISILRSFDAPPPEIVDDSELFAERVSTSASGLLSLAGVVADPVRSREHVLLSTIVGEAWRAGESLDLGALIARVITPPMARVGVLDMESFYPSAQRFDLATRLNGLLAAPAFASWLEGEPLDVGRLLYAPSGKPRIAVVSIAHLADAERMFFVSLLFNQVLGWMRRQPGTTSLRALLYMDEVAGYMPPVANPPSKPPLLTLLKQARAFGLGVVLATQNPGDLDYKGLSNLGTWWIGRLQTDRDKSKVLQGLEGAAASAAGGFDRTAMDRILSGLGKRVFLQHNVHDVAPTVFETRWCLSYLRGPLTRDQIRQLTPRDEPQAPAEPVPAGSAATTTSAALPPPPPAVPASARPVLPPAIAQLFVSSRGRAVVHYEPRLLVAGQIGFSDARHDVREVRDLVVSVPIADGPLPIDWTRASTLDVSLADLDPEPVPGATFADPPAAATQPKNYAAWEKEFVRWAADTQVVELFRHPGLKLVSRPGEDEREFRIRLQLAGHEKRDADKARIEQKYQPRFRQLQQRLATAETRHAREAQQAQQQKLQTALSFGATIAGALFGNRRATVGTIGRATTAARGVGRSMKEAQDVKRAEESVEAVRAAIASAEAELAAELEAIEAAADYARAPLETVVVRPKRTQIVVRKTALAWVPSDVA